MSTPAVRQLIFFVSVWYRIACFWAVRGGWCRTGTLCRGKEVEDGCPANSFLAEITGKNLAPVC